MKYLLKIFLIILPLTSLSQSGYLGSKTNIHFNISNALTPFQYKGKQIDETNYKRTNLNLNSSFALTVNRVLNDRVQIGLGYRYTPMYLFSNTVDINIPYPTDPNFFTERKAFIMNGIRIDNHSLVFNFRKFKNGISPIGKSWGFDIEYGKASITDITVDYATNVTETSTGYFNDRYAINTTAEDFIKGTVTYPGESKVNSFVLKGYIGRTIPVSSKIGIDLSLSMPLLRILKFNNEFGIAYLNSPRTQTISNSTQSNTSSIAYAIRKYNGFSLNIGVKYFL